MAAKKSDRVYGLSADEIKELAEEFKTTKKLPNPHRSGAYAFTISALVAMGVNKPHPIAKLHDAFRKAAGDEWYKAWASKEPRNKETGKDVDGRLLQNIRVLQRTKDFGRRLFEVGRKVLRTKGAVIDLTRDSKGGLLVTLNTNSATPQKPGRSANPKSDQKKAVRKAKGKPVAKRSRKQAGRSVNGVNEPTVQALSDQT